MISILCVNKNSIYKTLPVDCWDIERNAYGFTGPNPVITHAPCQQWSRLKAFAKPNDYEKQLAFFCLDKVIKNGGIFEHPAGSSFFKEAKIPRSAIYSIDQSWFGFPCAKRTYLFFSQCKPLAYPLRFEPVTKKVNDLHYSKRSDTTLELAKWLIACVQNKIDTEVSFDLYQKRYKLG